MRKAFMYTPVPPPGYICKNCDQRGGDPKRSHYKANCPEFFLPAVSREVDAWCRDIEPSTLSWRRRSPEQSPSALEEGLLPLPEVVTPAPRNIFARRPSIECCLRCCILKGLWDQHAPEACPNRDLPCNPPAWFMCATCGFPGARVGSHLDEDCPNLRLPEAVPEAEPEPLYFANGLTPDHECVDCGKKNLRGDGHRRRDCPRPKIQKERAHR